MTRICIEVDGDGTSTEPRVRTYSTVVGDGAQSDFVIDHNLNSQAVYVIAWDANTGAQRDDFSTTFTNSNRATVTFDSPPAVNGVKVQVIAVIPAP